MVNDFSRKANENHPYRWVIIAGVAGIYFGFGVIAASMAPIITEIRADLALSRSEMGLALGAWPLVYIVVAPFAGRFIDRFGLNWSLTLGAVIIMFSGLVRAGASGLVTLWLGTALFGIGGPLVSACAPTAVAVWFTNQKERRIAIGAYNTAPVLGGITVLTMSNSVFMPLTGSWRGTVISQTFFIVFAIIAWLLIVFRASDPPESLEVTSTESNSWRHLLADREFKMILLLGLVVFFVLHGAGAWLPEILREYRGFSAVAAGNWVAGALGISICASLVLPRFADRQKLPFVMAAVAGITAAAFLIIAWVPSDLDPLFILFAGARASLIPLVTLALMDSSSVNNKNMGTAYGLWFAVAEIGGVTGPLVVGVIGDSTFGFGGSLVALAVACGLFAGLAGLLRIIQISMPTPTQLEDSSGVIR